MGREGKRRSHLYSFAPPRQNPGRGHSHPSLTPSATSRGWAAVPEGLRGSAEPELRWGGRPGGSAPRRRGGKGRTGGGCAAEQGDAEPRGAPRQVGLAPHGAVGVREGLGGAAGWQRERSGEGKGAPGKGSPGRGEPRGSPPPRFALLAFFCCSTACTLST